MRVFVAMSGGVDSSVAAALLVAQGHEVSGITMRLPGRHAGNAARPGTDPARDARLVCDLLGIEHHVVDAREVFREQVIEPFARAYAHGTTPNPCISCNAHVKFGWLLEHSLERGAEAMATGHYARVTRDAGGTSWLERGIDVDKDQSYFLYRLVPPRLDRILFPLGELTKGHVRRIAEEHRLPTATRSESQEMCFVEPDRHAELVGRSFPEALVPGEIVDMQGLVIGTHEGIARYTIGQRKGLGIASPDPLYVIGIDARLKRVVAGPRSALEVTAVEAADAIWRLPAAPEPDPAATPRTAGVRVDIQTRYRMSPVPGTTHYEAGRLTIALEEPVISVAPGQAVVCYVADRVVGGGVIACSS